MVSIEGKTALVTGASAGIGKSTVLMLLLAGVKVYAAARRVEKMEDIQNMGAQAVKMDVTDEASIVLSVHSILEKEGAIDILINNAGYGLYGAIEDIPMDEARRQFEVNILGLARLTQLVLPRMRQNRYGKIVNISSVGGKIYTPLGAWYHASKHALEGFSDCLRIETAPFGIDVVIVEPGGTATEWGTIAVENLKRISGHGAYAEMADKVAIRLAQTFSSNKFAKPAAIAKVILKAVTARKPKTRYVAGYMAGPVLLLRRWLGDRMFDKMIKSKML